MVPKGFKYSGVRCGLKNKRNDLGLIYSDRPAKSGGVFTTNFARAACVDHSREVVSRGTIRGLVVNSGNANCCTGEQGIRDTKTMATLAAASMGVLPEEVAVASTGVIGHLIDMSKVEQGIAEAAPLLSEDPVPFVDAILTTDLVEKWALVYVTREGHVSEVLDTKSQGLLTIPADAAKVYGVAKGSGMISPNMATMLSFVTTDLSADPIDLQSVVKKVADKSFNCMTVDGDTSTNDMLIVFANGAAEFSVESNVFESALAAVCISLAKQVARDGEGATKLVEVRVTGSSDPNKIARTIADSPLVKTAMFGCDPNWGRILMAAGRAGVPFELGAVTLAIKAGDEEFLLFESGGPASFDAKRVSSALKADHVIIDLGLGDGQSATVYTCDLGYGYVRINAEYRT